MAAGERFFKVLRDVLLLTEEVKRLNGQVEKLGEKVERIDKRMVRIETIVEIAEVSSGKRLSEPSS